MTQNHHTPLVPTDTVDAATINNPLSDLDGAISGISSSGTSFPVTPNEGDRFIHTTDKITYEYHDGKWRPILYTRDLAIIIDGGGSAITAGEKYFLRIPFNCQIIWWYIAADQSGSIQFDLQVDTWANFPPDGSDSIVASAPPALSSAQNDDSGTLTGWTAQLNEGDWLRFYVDSATTVTKVTLVLVAELIDGS